MSNSKKLPVSVVVLTKNEELDLARCLQSLSWSDDIHVFDSFSSDGTIDIAKSFGAQITQRVFDNWSSHQNWGLQNLPFKYDWVYYSDADEIVSPSLVDEISEVIGRDCEQVAYSIRRRDYFRGTWLKWSTPSPFNIRLFRLGKLRYERLTNPVSVVDGSIGYIRSHFDHYPFSKGIEHWFAKHNRYSSQEAAQIRAECELGYKFSLAKALFSADRNERRRHQKGIYMKLPWRPIIMFFYLYVFRLGFLDGRAGLTFVVLRCVYEYMIVLKVDETERPV